MERDQARFLCAGDAAAEVSFHRRFRQSEKIVPGLFDHFQPVGPVEEILVEMIAECCWKMRRLQIAESASIKVDMLHQEKILRITDHRKSLFSLISEAFDEAEKKAGELGYVDDALVKTILEFDAEQWLQDDFVLANQKARELAIQRDDGSNLGRHQAVKKAQSVLRRRLHALKERCLEMEEHAADFESRWQEPYYAQHLLPEPAMMDNLLRYQSAAERRFYRTIAELERRQRQRLGNAVPDRLELTIKMLEPINPDCNIASDQPSPH